jgi:type I restriction enzyme S subunit
MKWKYGLFEEMAHFRNGLNFLRSDTGEKVKIVGVGDFQQNFRIGFGQLDSVRISGSLGDDDLLKDNDLLFVRSNGNKALIGRCILIEGVNDRTSFSGFTIRARLVDSKIDPTFVGYFFQSGGAKRAISYAGGGTNISNLSQSILAELEIPTPPLPEQRKIADILTTWDEALTQLDALIEAQEHRKKALMQQLLTGRRRLKGFDQSKGKTASDRFGTYPADWKRVRLGEIANEVPTKNADGTDLPVLSCTKHRGLVLSQEYFGKRVYAEDTSGYRVVQRGEFAYATNHIEEGSIGYQNLCDAGLVSPIYTVFKTTEAVDDSYLFRVLKSPLLIHFYQINTSASVDRRGSLRYDEFSRIHIWLPGKEEQTAIAQVFDTVDQQLTLLRTQRAAIDHQKRGLMQRLLTGKLRVTTNQTSL